MSCLSTCTGRFKTLPLTGATLPVPNFAIIVCRDYRNGFYTALALLGQEEEDYVIHLGDYIYEALPAIFKANPRTVPPFPSGGTTIPVDLDDFRHLYQVYRSDRNQQAVHENFACIQLWDDHEFANDCNLDDNSADKRHHAATGAAARCESSVVGVRLSQRAVHAEWRQLGNVDSGISQIQLRNAGEVQKQWLTGSKATWKFWANEVMLMQLKFAGLIYLNLDHWIETAKNGRHF